MGGFKWIGFVAGRYVAKGRGNSPSLVFAVLGIATGVLALTVILAVMNGFQLGFIESILEISSYHVRIEGAFPVVQGPPLEERVRNVPGIVSAVPFREFHGLVRGNRGGVQGALVRGLVPNALELDPGMAAKLDFEEGSFDIRDSRSVILGAELALRLGVRPGDQLSLLSLSASLGGDAPAEDYHFTLTGVFRTGFYEYDLGWGFINFDRAGDFVNPGQPPSLGIKLDNRWRDRRAQDLIRTFLDTFPGTENLVIRTWRDYNRVFFGALRTEKLLMFILVGLIFIVVGLNIFQAQRRNVLERRDEIGLLRALGAGDRAVRLIFVWDGFIIGVLGASLGMILGLLIAFNISGFFTLLEGIVNRFIALINYVSGFLGGTSGPEEFAVFSPQIFYIKEIPSRVIPREAFIIFLFGFLSALIAAWFASGKVSRTKPAEVLRYE